MSDDELTPIDMAKHFNQPVPQPDLPDFNKMTGEEIIAWEKAQENSHDTFRIAARVKNAVVLSGLTISPVGHILCNSIVHVLKDLYNFAETLEDKKKEELVEKIRKYEKVPLRIIELSMKAKK